VAGDRYDVMVVGAGPAGSVASLVLARGGARVALVDKAAFPRDKACGDLVGPRGVQVLTELGMQPAGRRVGDMEVAGPTGRRVLLQASAGITYPGFALAVARYELDAWLRDAALAAGADAFTGRATTPRFAADGQLEGFSVEAGDADRHDVVADVVIGADGALSRVGAAAGLVDERRVLWGFAVRSYLPASPSLPRIVFWEPHTWAGYPGYGWWFPGADDQGNIGLGIGVVGDRRAAARVARDLEPFTKTVVPSGLTMGPRLGGWLKMGMTGTIPARGRTLLVGDAAGLVNSLQGEGIAQALGSGRDAAEAILASGPSGAAQRYRAQVARRYAPYASKTGPLTAWMLRRPEVIAGVGRLLTAPGVGRTLAPGWAVYWNDLLAGATPGPGRTLAAVADRIAGAVTGRSADSRSVWSSVADRPDAPLRLLEDRSLPGGGSEIRSG
jgi:menaquinone-9 beta-reductase